MKDWSAEQRAMIEVNLRATHWKQLVRQLKTTVVQHHAAIELPEMIRRWLEVDRTPPRTEAEAADMAREVRALQAWADSRADGESVRWFDGRTEALPVLGWVVEAAHVLRDGVRWWVFAACRHADDAPLVGPTMPAPASPADLRKLRRIIDFAGGNSRRELLRSGSISQEDHDAFVAAGRPDLAVYGKIFYWWRA